jgi:hypothetical protein
MRKRRNPIKVFNSVDSASGYAIRFGQSKSGYWSAVTLATGMCVVGTGSTLGKCRKSIRDGIRYTLEWLKEDGDPIPEPEGHSVPFPY